MTLLIRNNSRPLPLCGKRGASNWPWPTMCNMGQNCGMGWRLSKRFDEKMMSPTLLSIFVLILLSTGSAGPVNSRNMAETGGVEPMPQDGAIEEYWRSGGIFYRGFVEDGELEGVFKKWYEDGTPMSVAKFRRGIYVDTMIVWHSNGQQYEMSIFKEGNPILTRNWNVQGLLRFQATNVTDSTCRTMRWNEAGYLVKDTLEICSQVRIGAKP
jgi:hypothetical protein